MVDAVLAGSAILAGLVIVFVIDMGRRIYLIQRYPHAYKAEKAEDGKTYAEEKREEAHGILRRLK